MQRPSGRREQDPFSADGMGWRQGGGDEREGDRKGRQGRQTMRTF